MAFIEIIDIIIIIGFITVILAIFLSGRFFYKESKGKPENYRKYLLWISLFFMLYGINRIIFFLHELFFDPFLWSLSFEEYFSILEQEEWKYIRYDIIWRVGTATGAYAILIFLYVFEVQILEKKTHFVLSIIQGITTTISLILGPEGDKLNIGRYILYFGLIPTIAIPFIYIYLGIRASGPARKRMLGAGIGFLIFYLGISANSVAGKNLMYYLYGLIGLQIAYLLYALLIVIGLFIYIKSIKEPKKVKIPKKVRIRPEFEFDESQQSLVEVLAQSRPSEITEEEVMFYREQEICLVCKGKLSRLIYLCPKCKALYCIKCYSVLNNTENACWACETPFDESKPVKPVKIEEELIEIDIKNGKKKKPKFK